MKRKLIGLGLLAAFAVSLLALAPVSADTKTKQIQFKVEIYRDVNSDWCNKILPDCKPGSSLPISGDTPNAVRQALADSGAKLTGSPIITTLDNTQAQIQINTTMPASPIKDGEQASTVNLVTTIKVLPKVGKDASVTLTLNAKLPYVEDVVTIVGTDVYTNSVPRYVDADVTLRLAKGESLLWTTANLPSGTQMAVILTPKIVD